MKRNWRLMVIMLNVTPKMIQSQGERKSVEEKTNIYPFSPVIPVEPQSQQQGLQEVLTSVLDLSDGAATPEYLRVKLWNGLW